MAVNIKIKDAKKMYGKNTVIEDLSLDIKGENFLHCWDLQDVVKLLF